MDAQKQVELLIKGCSEVISPEALAAKITKSLASGKPLKIKAGFDPSSPDIHLGHAVLLRKLRQFQDLGHEVVFIIGDTTASIGDPSGQSQTRPMLSQDQIKINAQTYQKQAFKILNPKKTQTVFNSRWFDAFKLKDVMNLASRVTVSQIIQRDDFAKRLADNKPVSLMELYYPLLQGYDSVQIEADVELGGNDQKFNLLMGRELQKERGQEPQVVMTLPLLVGLDGTHKMSKSLSNHVGILDEPTQMFGKLMSIPDTLMWNYYELLTDKVVPSLQRQVKEGSLHPKVCKEELAETLVRWLWNDASARDARQEFERVFSQKENPAEIPVFKFKAGEHLLSKLLIESGLVDSGNDARRLIEQNAVSVDKMTVTDPKYLLKLEGTDKLIKVGKRKFAHFRAEQI